MRSLFLKIFLWYWLTVFAAGIALALTLILAPTGVAARWHAAWREDAHAYARTAAQEWERGGAAAATAYLDRIDATTHLRACLFDDHAHPLAGRNCDLFLPYAVNVLRPDAEGHAFFEGLRIAIHVNSPTGRAYAFVGNLPPGPRGFAPVTHAAVFMRLFIVVLVSGGVCYLLTRYLTVPVLRLRHAARRLAAGELDARAGSSLQQRRDELGDLVRDFNVMAERIEQLVTSQRQLISDVSHELRSPLARMSASLGVARQRLGNDEIFERMQRDIARLNEMIGSLLTLARLEMTPRVPEMKPVDLGALLSEIVSDAEFEARERGCSVSLTRKGECPVNANAGLLRSAIENIIRNAIRYTAAGTSVEVDLQCDHRNGDSAALISVRDHGPGVPEGELANIFRPFYRVADARDRQSGGAGLGLAITDRVVRAHGGSLRAQNTGNGLKVDLAIPMSGAVQHA